jgi:hypothetical protein
MSDPVAPESVPDLGDDEIWEPDPDGELPEETGRHLRVVPPRPIVRFSAPDIHDAIASTAFALALTDTGDPMLFQRAHELVAVVGAPVPKPGERAPVTEETPTVRSLSVPAFVPRLTRHVEFQRYKKPTEKELMAAAAAQRDAPDGWTTCAPPPQLVASMLAIGEWPAIRRLSGVIETPSMRPDGTILDAPGYDAPTRTLYVPSADYVPVDASPSHSDAVLAYAKLRDVFIDFPYVTESHRVAAVAAILTLLVRPAIRSSVPCWLFDASAARSGKSLQTDVIALITTGRPASRCTYPENDEELEKVLSSYALAGVRIIPLDNVARPFGGAPLDKAITAVDTVDLRVLGSSEMRTLPWVAVVLASGNNVRARGDMLARVLSPRLESGLDNPETRTEFVHPERGDSDRMKEWAKANRAELVHAGLTIVRAFVAAGRPAQPCGRWGGFDAWVRLVAHSLVWVGAPDPMGARRGLTDDEDPTRLAEATLVDGWARIQTAVDHRGLTVKSALSMLYPQRHPSDDSPPDGYDDVREAIEELTSARPGLAPSVRQLGEALRRLKSRPVNGQKLCPGEHVHAGVVRWRVVPAR